MSRRCAVTIATLVAASVMLTAALHGATLVGKQPANRWAQLHPFAPLQARITAVLQKWKMPGVAAAISLDGRLVYAAGYGMADIEAGVPMQPDTLMRLASLSKVVTAVGVLRLVDEGRLALDDKAFALLADLPPLPGTTPDPRLDDITIRHLLQHTSGWEFGPGADPFLREVNHRVAEASGLPAPVDCPAVIRYMRGQPLNFDPGTHYAYANLNYCILGRVIERASGQSYFDYMRARVLEPSGIARGQLGHSLLSQRIAGEAKYYGFPFLAPPAVAGVTGPVEWPYGGFNLEAMDAFGGWVMSAVDVLRFMAAIEGHGRGPLLRRETIAQIEARPARAPANLALYRGLGFLIRPIGDGANWWTYGYLPGSVSYVVRAPNGFSGVILANGTGTAESDLSSNTLTLELEQALLTGAGEVRSWPSDNLFDRFP